TRPTSGSPGSPRASRSSGWPACRCRWSSTSAPGCSPHIRGCPRSPPPPGRCGRGRGWSPPPATSCSAARSAACSSGTPTSSRGCAATPSRGPCGWTSSPSPRWRPRSPGRCRRSGRVWRPTGPSCCAAPGRWSRRWRRTSRRRRWRVSAPSGAAGLPGWSCPAPRWRWTTGSPCPCARARRGGGDGGRAGVMHVVATAGHVDHGKSALVRALTGTEPDRLAEERRRGLSIQLGYAWTTLPGAGEVAFVDVPGHERFISTTLAGLGPVPAVLFVVAADDPWMPQAAEHLAALDALGVEHGVLAVTRADLADPGPARERALAELAATSLRGVPAVAVSARTGGGLDELRAALARMVSALPAPPADAAVGLWVDRSFTVAGAGTVVTGTLPAGRVAPGDRLASAGTEHRVRAVQSLGRD